MLQMISMGSMKNMRHWSNPVDCSFLPASFNYFICWFTRGVRCVKVAKVSVGESSKRSAAEVTKVGKHFYYHFFLLELFSALTAVSVREFATGSRRSSSVRVSKPLQLGGDALMFELGGVRYMTWQMAMAIVACNVPGQDCFVSHESIHVERSEYKHQGCWWLLGGTGTVRHSDSMQH